MKQVFQDLRQGSTFVQEVPVPSVGDNALLIQTSRSLISAGTERMLVEFGRGSLLQKAKSQPDKVRQVLDKIRTEGLMPTLETVFARLGEPLPLGYCNAGVVVDKGAGIRDFAISDRVVSNGGHAEYVSIGRNLCAKIPDEVSDDEAAFTVLGSIALQGVRLVNPALGETVFVMGLGLIGLVTIQLLRANGVRVIGSDFSKERLELARQLGCETVDLSAGSDPVDAAMAATGGMGVDGVLITASTTSNEPVRQAARMSRKRGRIVLVGVTGLELNRAEFYEKELTFQVSCSYGPGRYDPRYEEEGIDYPYGFVRWTEQRNFTAVLQLMASGKLDVKPLVSKRVAIENAADAYSALVDDSSVMGILLTYPEPQERATGDDLRTKRQVTKDAAPSGACRLGIIGAGNYTRIALLPALKKVDCAVVGIASAKGASGTIAAKKFDIPRSVTDINYLLDDQEINGIVITTRHDSHPKLAERALAAGKHVFIEKPLAIDMDGLRTVNTAVQAAGPGQMLMVGFNRRFSPHVKKMKELISGRSSPLTAEYTVNAGAIPAETWIQDPKVGGGRIIGEACHFIDVLRFLVGHPIVSVTAEQVDSSPDRVDEDKMTILLKFADGSIGTVHYWANGSKSYIKEQMRLFEGGRILEQFNYRLTKGYGFNNFNKLKTARVEKGHVEELSEFCSRISSGGQTPIPFVEQMEVSLASLAAVESAVSGERQLISRWWDRLNVGASTAD